MRKAARALVMGAGISGIRAALDLAEVGHQVILADKDVIPGGILLSLDKQFPDNHCGLCRMLPKDLQGRIWNSCMRRGFFHPGIEFRPGLVLDDVQGAPGNITARMFQHSLEVDPGECTGCLECVQACPVFSPEPQFQESGQRKAIHRAGPHRPPYHLSIDPGACTLCGRCLEVCPTGAISLAPEPEPQDIENLDFVLLATGVDYYAPEVHNLYSSSKWLDVITSLDFERLISGVGPTQGELLRPSDSRPVRKAAWIQCVGSRNLKLNADHCSGICCMIALKQAKLAKDKGVDPAIFYIDMRTSGRDWQDYLDQAQGVRLIRCRPHSVTRDLGQSSLQIAYAPTPGEQADEDFDLVILSVGRDPQHTLPEYAGNDGVFVLQGAERVLDIARSLISASAEAGRAIRMYAPKNLPAPEEETNQDQSPVHSAVLVVGAGPAGLSAALSLAEQGAPVHLVEKRADLGGNALEYYQGRDQELVQTLTEKVSKHPGINVLTHSRVLSSSGPGGRFATRIRSHEGQEQTLAHGAAILASGGKQAATDSHGEKVISLFDLNRQILAPEASYQPPRCTAFILCHQCRQEPRNYCSRICCKKALECAIQLRELQPDAEVVIFYRDIILQGDEEQIYTRARKSGVKFVPYQPENPPLFQAGEDEVTVSGYDPYLGEKIELKAGQLVLASGVEPESGTELAGIFGIETTPAGFVPEADSKYRPVDTSRSGVFVCGLAKNPVLVEEAVFEGEAAAQRSLGWLTRGKKTWPGAFIRVRPALCSLCALCAQACPFQARYQDMETGAMGVDPLACQGCGACVAACPNQASTWAEQEKEDEHELN